MKKNIKMICYGPIAFGPEYQSSWEDVWIRYFSGKRKVIQEGPCIICKEDLSCEIEINERRLPVSDWKEEQLDELRKVEEEFNKGNKFVIVEVAPGLPDIYVNSGYINRQLAEEAVEWYLKRKGVLKSKPRFRWEKRKKDSCLIPVGYNDL
jgi:hypothetical protein